MTGWKIAPREPTHEMALKAWQVFDEEEEDAVENARLAVKFAIAAAPPFDVTDEMRGAMAGEISRFGYRTMPGSTYAVIDSKDRERPHEFFSDMRAAVKRCNELNADAAIAALVKAMEG